MCKLTAATHLIVKIGRQSRLYFGFITTAPAALDAPGTITLHAHTFQGMSGFLAPGIDATDVARDAPGRIVLVDANEYAWQEAHYRSHNHQLFVTDQMFAGPNVFEFWVWQKLRLSPV